jgi:ribosomal protein L22
MNFSHKLLVIFIVTISTLSTTVYADWRSLLKDITAVGSDILSDDSGSSSLDSNTIVSGLKEALSIGSKRAVNVVSKPNGYLSNELIKITMPPKLKQAGDLMRKFGLSSYADTFEQSMNHAAEKAAPQATALIIDAIKNMSIEDAKTILQGEDDAATQYFREKTTPQLTELFRPTIDSSLNEVGTTKYYNDLTGKIADIPIVGEKIDMNLTDYVTEQALNGLFTMIALEEKKIRENPAARTTELLKQVFGK